MTLRSSPHGRGIQILSVTLACELKPFLSKIVKSCGTKLDLSLKRGCGTECIDPVNFETSSRT